MEAHRKSRGLFYCAIVIRPAATSVMHLHQIFKGQLTADARAHFSGNLNVFLNGYSVSISFPHGSLASADLHILPFNGAMLFGRYEDGSKIVESAYCLEMSGSNVGFYRSGGGRDGEFEEFRIKHVKIIGSYGSAGLTVSFSAATWPGDDVTYSAKERNENVYEAIELTADFVVPPDRLAQFLGLTASHAHVRDVFARFPWAHLLQFGE